MKRFALGFICGALLFGGTAVLAEGVSLVGKRVDGEIPVIYNDEPLVAKAITVEGTSYLPVRTVGNTLGAKIEYKDGAVYVEKADEYEALKEKILNDLKFEAQKEELQKEISKLQTAIENSRRNISELEKQIAAIEYPDDPVREALLRTKASVENIIQQHEAKIRELQVHLAALEQQQSNPESEE